MDNNKKNDTDVSETTMDPSLPQLTKTNGRDWRLFNVIILGVAFMLIFTAFQTSSMAEVNVLDGARNESGGNFTGSGYTSLAAIYVVFALSNWIAPSIVILIGPKITMIIGGALYTLFILSFLKPMTWALYTGSVLVGFGAAIIWTGQGNFLTINSDSSTIGRNSGLFWALLQCSMLFGNLYVYFALRGVTIITGHARTMLYIILSSVCAAGVLTFLILRKTTSIASLVEIQDPNATKKSDNALQAFKRSIKLMLTKEMLLLSLVFAYTGFELTFFSGVFTSMVGHNKHFSHQAKSYIGLCGMLIGVGEIIGGLLFGIFGKRTNKYGRDPIVLIGFLTHMLAFILIFISMPPDSPLHDTTAPTYIYSSPYIALTCAFLLGFGDSCYNTQIYSLLGFMYAEDSAPAFAMFKFIQSITAAGGFFYSDILLLQWQLLILVVSGVIGTLSFFKVEWESTQRYKQGYSRISSE